MSSEMTEHVLRVARSDGGDPVLIHVVAESKDDLDLIVEGTEGSAPFFVSYICSLLTRLLLPRWTTSDGDTVKHARLSRLLSKNSPVNGEEWEHILRSKLLQQPLKDDDTLLQNFELSANINGNQLILAFRKNISGIHQRIGEIALDKNEDHELDTIAWIAVAVSRSDALSEQVRDQDARYREQSVTVQKLQEQLDELVKAKEYHERVLLEKFCELLNLKKLKIRDQQRLLANSKVSADVAGAVRANRDEDGTRDRKPLPSRTRKRKADKGAEKSAQAEEDDDFENAQQNHDETTPDKSDLDETDEAIDEDDLDSLPIRTINNDSSGSGNMGKTLEIADGGNKNGKSMTPPPIRSLPFVTLGGRGAVGDQDAEIPASAPDKTVPGFQQESDRETESDDEL